ncbi:MAG TPA: CAP domain-containing protein [Prolixibacteraceae bacterium]|jgi:hypothetical protein
MRLLILIVVMTGLGGCKISELKKAANEKTSYITDFQQYTLKEINLARVHPSEYAELRLKANKDYSTDNGSYDYLRNLMPVGPLTINQSLHQSATKYAMLLAQKKLIKNDADGTPLSRAIRNEYRGNIVGENIAVNSEKKSDARLNPRDAAISFVKLLIIDKGVDNFGHRETILHSSFSSVGVGFGQDTTGICTNYVVQDFGNR